MRAYNVRCLLHTYTAKEFAILKDNGAIEMPPFLPAKHRTQETWAVLQERWQLRGQPAL